MLANIIFLLSFLIITFSSFGLCIRNEDMIDVERKIPGKVKFFPDDDGVTFAESRQFHEGLSPGSTFTFPSKYQEDNSFNINEIPTNKRDDIYSKPQVNILGENPYDSAFNTGEYYKTSSTGSNSANNYPSNQNYPNTIYATNGNGRDVPNYQTYNDPNYYPSNYAQNYDYLHGNRPSYNRPPNYSGRPISLGPFNQYQYQQSASPYPGSFSSPIPQGYPPVHGGGQYSDGGGGGFPSLFSNPLANFFNNFRAPSGQFSEQFSRALEDIAKNDDLQCVPKLLCQMVGDPNRRKHLPEFISAPAFTALIAAVPSTSSSPTLVFGRAALLGFTGGDDSCRSIYTRCPQNEDHLLYYLNNHRGGFFRFFNGGGAFGDEPTSQYNPSPQNQNHFPSHYQQNYRPEPSTTDSSGINLSNIGANFGLLSNLASLFTSANQIPSGNFKNVGESVTNLLSGLVSNRFSSRKLRKRSLDANEESIEISNIEDVLRDRKENTTEVLITAKTLAENETKLEDDYDDDTSSEDEVEGRILNKKLYSDYFEHHDDKVLFPTNEHKISSHRFRGQKGFNNNDEIDIKFPSHYNDRESHRNGKRINFEDEFNYAPYYPFDDHSRDRPYGTQMIFPDRTGTGNLRFDNNDFHTQRDRDRDQYGKILNRPDYNRDYYRPEYDENTKKPYYGDSDRYRPSYSSGSNRYDYERTTKRPDHSQSYYTNRYTTERPYTQNYYGSSRPYDYDNYYSNRYTTPRPYTTQDNYTTRRPSYTHDYYTTRYTTQRPKEPNLNVYVTNSQGVVEYYINPRGDKIYI